MSATATTYKSPLNDPVSWMRGQDFQAPLSNDELADAQEILDSVLGLTRDNKSIAKIVWNGDSRYWKDIYVDWDMNGQPIERIKRPQVLFRTILDPHGAYVRDVFVPRYIVLTRLEPEQYYGTWAISSKFYCPERRSWCQYKPKEPPKELYLYFATIAHHHGNCCQVAARKEVDCFGDYGDPLHFIPTARNIRKGMELSGLPENHPFAGSRVA